MLSFVVLMVWTHLCFSEISHPCSFNSMCSCRSTNSSYIKDVSCVGVPFYKLPELPHSHISHLDVVGAGLDTVDSDSLGSQVETLRLITNNIINIGDKTFLNLISSLDAEDWSYLRDTLDTLFLGENDLQELPLEVLVSLRRLAWLNLDHNNLRTVRVENLPESLQTLSVQHNYLSELPDIEPLYRLVRLCLRGNNLRSVTVRPVHRRRQKLTVTMGESVLADQLAGVSLPRLRHLVITGRALIKFRELVVEISGTQVQDIPAGFFAGLSKTAHLPINLRDNSLLSLNPSAFYSNTSSWEHIGTKLITGGLLLHDNPWLCDCGLVWLGHWLRRWLRESLQIHTAPLDAAQHLVLVTRAATCTDHRTGRQTPLLDIYPEELSCHASDLSHSADWRPSSIVRTLIVVYVLAR
ncbi:biological adhesion [Homalodisca vitripennis]|nr:biological adhesion [Homalodisca vitripennis]